MNPELTPKYLHLDTVSDSTNCNNIDQHVFNNKVHVHHDCKECT